MNRFSWMVAGSLAVAIAATAGPPWPWMSAAQAQRASAYERIREFLGRDAGHQGRGRDSGSRDGGSLCLVNPGTDETVWTVQPLAVVKGPVESFVLKPLGAEHTPQPTPVRPNESGVQVIYSGAPLEPGQSYEWIFYQRNRLRELVEHDIPFRVMAAGDGRDRITTELEQLDAELAADGASQDDRAAARANYFFDHGLLADSFQAMFSVESPSENLIAAREAAVEDICSQELSP
ncbi:hypothetical protein [Nodosilinea nodulosa]|uniref:hypothetical protein n=1 Tax=Nodosilinea nodulosa TaxID=416001 RepID=UPI000305DD4A|nr:hypothetical protein [Nodosilinea nodulosa]